MEATIIHQITTVSTTIADLMRAQIGEEVRMVEVVMEETVVCRVIITVQGEANHLITATIIAAVAVATTEVTQMIINSSEDTSTQVV